MEGRKLCTILDKAGIIEKNTFFTEIGTIDIPWPSRRINMGPWEKMFHNISTFLVGHHFCEYPDFLIFDKDVDGAPDKSISAFIAKYLEEHDLAHFYALNRVCFDLIENLVGLIDIAGEDLSIDFEDTIAENVELCPEIRSIINENALIHELHKVAETKHTSKERCEIPPNMYALGQLSYELHKTIENGSWQMEEKAHAYLCSLTIGNYKHFDYESFVYQLSRGIDCEDTIDNFIPYLQEEAKSRNYHCDYQIWYEAEVLRLIQWAEIGNLNEYVKEFCNNISFVNQFSSILKDCPEGKILNYMSFFLRPPFALLRSDLALQLLNTKLKKYIYVCQKFLQDDIEHAKSLFDNVTCHQFKLTISACYVFGAYRLGIDQFDLNTVKNSTSYLQAYQYSDASFAPSEYRPYYNCLLCSMVIHALWISKAFGWKRTVRRTLKFLGKQQDSYGVWYDGEFINNGYLTGLILDTFELLAEKPTITFTLPHPNIKGEETPTSSEQPKLHKIVNHIEIGTIQNIFGKMPQSGSSPKKKKTKKSKVVDAARESKFREWKNCGDACLVFNSKERIIFYYKEKDYDLRLRHSGPVYELIRELAWGECKRDDLFANKKISFTKKGTRRVLSDVFRRTNELLNLKVRLVAMKHNIADVPENIKFVGFDKIKKTYRFYMKTESE